MADRYLLETAILTDGYLLEDGTGVLLLETSSSSGAAVAGSLHAIEVGRGTLIRGLSKIEQGGTY